jgi:hypothetical protein
MENKGVRVFWNGIAAAFLLTGIFSWGILFYISA